MFLLFFFFSRGATVVSFLAATSVSHTAEEEDGRPNLFCLLVYGTTYAARAKKAVEEETLCWRSQVVVLSNPLAREHRKRTANRETEDPEAVSDTAYHAIERARVTKNPFGFVECFHVGTVLAAGTQEGSQAQRKIRKTFEDALRKVTHGYFCRFGFVTRAKRRNLGKGFIPKVWRLLCLSN